MASIKLAVMLVGSGRLGSHIADELLKRGDKVKIMVRDPSKIVEFEKRGVTLIKGDICKDPQDTLTKHLEGIDVVISAVQGGPETIIEGQKNLLSAAKVAGVKRFVPSDNAMDIFKVKDEIFGNMLRRRFSEEILHPSGVGYTNILNGAFLENGTIEFIGILDRANKKVNMYGTGDEKWQWTTLEDTARYTVEAIHDPSALNQVVKVCGDEISLNGFAKVLSEATGSTWSTNILGTEEDLRKLIAKNYKEQPQNIFAWMPLQYVWGSVSEKFILRPLWNDRYPNVHPTTVKAWVASQKW